MGPSSGLMREGCGHRYVTIAFDAIRTESCHDSFPAGLSASEGGFWSAGARLEKSSDGRESVIAGNFSKADRQGNKAVGLV